MAKDVARDVARGKKPGKKVETVARMTREQAKLLRKLAFDAYEPEAFSSDLTHAEAEQRICVLQAKLKLMSEPPHTQ